MRTFYIPTESASSSGENSITGKDIEKGILRITLENKEYFPREDCQIQISYGRKNKSISFGFRTDRSHVLYVGKDFMQTMKMRAGDRLKILRPTNNHFIFEKA